VVWKLDRLGRSLKHLIATIEALERRGIGFKSLSEQLDTMPSGRKLIFHLFGALAEFERTFIRERTLARLSAARARGRQGGRPKLLDALRAELARRLHADKANTVGDICRTLRISRSTLYRYLKEAAS
jgi:DNA invertase Pin-like site-specific DNA recombinase